MFWPTSSHHTSEHHRERRSSRRPTTTHGRRSHYFMHHPVYYYFLEGSSIYGGAALSSGGGHTHIRSHPHIRAYNTVTKHAFAACGHRRRRPSELHVRPRLVPVPRERDALLRRERVRPRVRLQYCHLINRGVEKLCG
jgi:hypothetical protein